MVIVSQACDIVQDWELEPYILVAPVLEIAEDLHARSWEGRLSPRLFALPALGGLEHPAADLRAICPVDKELVNSDAVERLPFRLDKRRQRRLRIWAGRRFARYAFPDDLEQEILGPLRKRLFKRWSTAEADGPLVRALEGVWVATSESGPTLKVLLVLKPESKTLSQLDTPDKIRAAVRKLLGPIINRANENGWKLKPQVSEPAEISAFELLYEYEELEIDLPRDAEGDGSR